MRAQLVHFCGLLAFGVLLFALGEGAFVIPGHFEPAAARGDWASLWPSRGAWLTVIFVSLYALLGVFALTLSAALRFSAKLTYFGALSLSLAGYFAAQLAPLFESFVSGGVLHALERTLIFMAVTFGLLFLDVMLDAGGRLRGLLYGFSAVSAATAVLVWLIPPASFASVRALWQSAALAALFFGAVPAWRALVKTAGSVALVPGLVLLGLSAGWDISADLTGFTSARLIAYGVFLFVSSLAAGMAREFLALHRTAETVSADLSRSERRLGAFYNATREGVCIRRGNVVLDVNPAFEALFGLPKERCVGAPFTRFFVIESQADVARGLDADATLEAVAARADGSPFEAELLNRTADAADPSIKVTAIRDITDFKRYRAELMRRNEELEELNKIVVDRELHMVELKQRIRAAGDPAARG